MPQKIESRTAIAFAGIEKSLTISKKTSTNNIEVSYNFRAIL